VATPAHYFKDEALADAWPRFDRYTTTRFVCLRTRRCDRVHIDGPLPHRDVTACSRHCGIVRVDSQRDTNGRASVAELRSKLCRALFGGLAGRGGETGATIPHDDRAVRFALGQPIGCRAVLRHGVLVTLETARAPPHPPRSRRATRYAFTTQRFRSARVVGSVVAVATRFYRHIVIRQGDHSAAQAALSAALSPGRSGQNRILSRCGWSSRSASFKSGTRRGQAPRSLAAHSRYQTSHGRFIE